MARLQQQQAEQEAALEVFAVLLGEVRAVPLYRCSSPCLSLGRIAVTTHTIP